MYKIDSNEIEADARLLILRYKTSLISYIHIILKYLKINTNCIILGLQFLFRRLCKALLLKITYLQSIKYKRPDQQIDFVKQLNQMTASKFNYIFRDKHRFRLNNSQWRGWCRFE